MQWMAAPQAIQGCPPGLEYLTQVEQLLVHQQVELLEGKVPWHFYRTRLLAVVFHNQPEYLG